MRVELETAILTLGCLQFAPSEIEIEEMRETI
jgi:hypothetical protein